MHDSKAIDPNAKPSEPEYRVLGFVLTRTVLWGLFVLLVSLAYFAANAEDSRANSVYLQAKPASALKGAGLGYVTGTLEAPEIGSRFVKPGAYLRIDQASEVYAWVLAANPKGSPIVRLDWSASPQDPKTFPVDDRSKPLFPNKLTLANVLPTPASVRAADGKSYAVDLGAIELPTSMEAVAPPREALLTAGYDVVDTPPDGSVTLYTSAACKTEPTGGCQRVVLRVVPRPSGTMTFIGQVDGARIDKFEGALKAGTGDFAQTLAAYKFARSATGLFLWLQRSLCFVGLGVAVFFLADPLRRVLRLPATTRPIEIAVAGAVVFGVAAFFLRGGALFELLVVVGIVLAGCRARPPG